MDVLSWNVQGAFPKYTPIERIEDQVQYIEENANCPDIIALNEVSRYRRDMWIKELREVGYSEIVHTLDWAEELGESDIPPHQDYSHVNGNLTAVHDEFRGENLTRLHPSIRYGPWDGSDLKDWSTNLPEKILHTEIEVEDSTLEIWNVRAVPGSMHGEEKVKILENTFHRVLKGSKSPCILTGDFNAPDRELSDGTTIPWRHEKEGEVARRWGEAELNILTGLEEKGMVDVFREQHGYGDLDILDVSHATQTDDPLAVSPGEIEGKRFDHMIASTELNPQACIYDQEGFACSDHAPMISTFGL
ncbi:endonuclease/exonuclease/phosphatase family protein [Haloferax namakaokahaiae]|uniref:Endonuclease/exonuclease/phosphatase family protein n=1 Tax=Haloferax namakaokahaiae TaxID=1748331 RepID=A0ABD5ZIZ6_9EURY